MSLMAKLKKNSKVKETDVLNKSKFFNHRGVVSTEVPSLNIALSGDPMGGLGSGMLVLAGPSKHFKTAFSLVIAKAYLDAHPEATLVFYDSEFGSPGSYFESFGIDTNKVLHTPVKNVEDLKFDITAQLELIDEENKSKKANEPLEKVIFIIDSIGNLASKKEVEDAKSEKSVADMSRAKALKSLFRITTPYLQMNDIPMLAINHTYKEIGLFPKDIVSGGTGIYYSANAIFIVGRRQEKVGTEVQGYSFIINIEKSRFVREKSKIPVEVTFEGGISKHSGLLDIALVTGHVAKPTNGWYQKVDKETGELVGTKLRTKDVGPMLLSLLSDSTFVQDIKDMYQLGKLPMLDFDQDINLETEVIDEVLNTVDE